MEGILLFDFDRTLLDTDALKIEQAHRVARATFLTVDEVQAGMASYIATLAQSYEFSAKEYAQSMQVKYGCNPTAVCNVYLADTEYISDFLFPDVLPVLTELKSRNTPMGIFSEANPPYQKIKIERSGVLSFIESKNVVVAPHKVVPEVVISLPKHSMLVDDSLRVINAMLELAPNSLEYIWLNRKDDERHAQARTIHSLSELLSFVF